MEDGDRLTSLRDVLLLRRAQPESGSGLYRFEVTPAMLEGVHDLAAHAPAWADVDDARLVYSCAYEAGRFAAERRLKTVFGLPEARGREREALELALDATLEPSAIAVRLRAAARTASEENCAGNVLAFRRPSSR